eukprot:8431_1
MSLILTFNNSLVIPQLVDNCHKILNNKHSLSKQFVIKGRAKIIFILRTLTSIIIPIIFGIIILNDCGNGWTLFWSPCYHENKTKFDIDADIDVYARGSEQPSIRLSDASKICGLQTIIWNKCIRAFFHSWSNIITQKLLLMVFMPIIITLFKVLKTHLLSKCYNQDPKKK